MSITELTLGVCWYILKCGSNIILNNHNYFLSSEPILINIGIGKEDTVMCGIFAAGACG